MRRWDVGPGWILLGPIIAFALLAGGLVITSNASAAPTPVTIDNAAPGLEENDDGSFKADLGFTNLTDSDVTLIAKPAADDDTNCRLAFSGSRGSIVPAAEHTSPTLTATNCELSDDRLLLEVTATGSAAPITLGVVAEKAKAEPEPDWNALLAFPVAFVGALVFALAIWWLWPWLFWWHTTTKRARRAEGGDSPGDVKRPKLWKGLAGLPDTYSFGDSWVTNITAIVALFTGIFASTDVLEAVLGDDAESSLALAAVGGAVAVALTGGGGIVVLATRTAKHDLITFGGLLLAAVFTLAGAFGGLWVAHAAGKELDFDGLQDWLLPAALIGITLLLAVYAYRTLMATIKQGLEVHHPDPSETILGANLIADAIRGKPEPEPPERKPKKPGEKAAEPDREELLREAKLAAFPAPRGARHSALL
jgi:uncharacterized membrane protein